MFFKAPCRRFTLLLSLLLVMFSASAVAAHPSPFQPLPQSSVSSADVLLPSWGASGAADKLWRSSNGSWLGMSLPVAGAYWRWIAADPFNPSRWLLLGNSDGSGDFLYQANGVRMRNGSAPALWMTTDAGATWLPVQLPTRGSYIAVSLNQVEWSTQTAGSWLVAGTVIGSTWNAAAVWRGSLQSTPTLLLLEETQRADWFALTYAVPGLADDAVVAEWDSPGSGTFGRLGYHQIGAGNLTQSGTGYLARGLQIERLPGTSPAVVAVDQWQAVSGPALLATTDYRTTAPTTRRVLDQGLWVTAATDGVYVGGRIGPYFQTPMGLLKVSDPLTTPTAAEVPTTISNEGIGFVRADRQTRGAIAALQGRQRAIYLRPGATAAWQILTTPTTPVADRLEVIVSSSRTPLDTGPTPPRFTRSYYEQTIDPLVHRRQGCLARQEGQQGIVVLNYGSPRNLGTKNTPVYGAGLIYETFVSDNLRVSASRTQIIAAVKAFADGYYNWRACQDEGFPIAQPIAPDLTIAIGTSNSSFDRSVVVDGQRVSYHVINPDLTFDHGQDWAMMVIEIADYLRQRRYRGLTAAGAYDAEPRWWSVDINSNDDDYRDQRYIQPTLDWANGYGGVAGALPLYNFGSLDGAPRDSSWLNPKHPRYAEFNQTLADVYVLSSGKLRRALPQIYNAAYAKEWYQLRRYSLLRKPAGYDVILSGVMTQIGSSSRQYGDARPWQVFKLDLIKTNGIIETFPPAQGWRAMHDALHRTLIQPLRLTSNLGPPLPDSFLVAPSAPPSATFELTPTQACQPSYSPNDALLPYRFYAQPSCFPAGTTFPRDTTFSTRFVLPSQYQPVFSTLTNQALPWATDIQFGCLASECAYERLPRN